MREKVLASPARRLAETRPPDPQIIEKQVHLEQLPETNQLPEVGNQAERPPEKDAETIVKEIERQKLQKELQRLQGEHNKR